MYLNRINSNQIHELSYHFLVLNGGSKPRFSGKSDVENRLAKNVSRHAKSRKNNESKVF